MSALSSCGVFSCGARGSSGVFSLQATGMPPASSVGGGLKTQVTGNAARREAGGDLVCSGPSMSATGSSQLIGLPEGAW